MQVTENNLILVLIALVVVMNVIFFISMSRKNKSKKKLIAEAKKSLLGYLKKIKISSDDYFRMIEKYQSENTGLPEEIDLHDLSSVHPSSLNKTIFIFLSREFTLSDFKMGSFIDFSRLFDSCQELNSAINLFNYAVKDLSTEFLDHRKIYFENIVALSKMHDNLGEFLHKPPDKSGTSDWVQNYFRIFGDWFRKGADKRIEFTRSEIVLRILNLNRTSNQNKYLLVTNDSALKCEFAFLSMSKIQGKLHENLNRLKFLCRKTSRIAVKMASAMSPERALQKDIVPNFNPRNGKRKFPLLRYVLLLTSLVFLYFFCSLFLKGVDKQPIRGVTSLLNLRQPLNSGIILSDSFHGILKDTNGFVRGIDISKYQGNIVTEINQDDSLSFIICKATEGNTEIDKDFVTNINIIHRKGLIPGAYHFYRSNDDPIRQAKHFTSLYILLDSVDIPPILDIEEKGLVPGTTIDSLQKTLLIFLHELENLTGRQPVIYVSLYFANKYLNNTLFTNYPLWLAEYSGKDIPDIPLAWKQKGYLFWQKSARISMYSQYVDFDIFHGSKRDLINFIQL